MPVNMHVSLPCVLYTDGRERLWAFPSTFAVCSGLLHKWKLQHVCRIITVVMYLPVSGAQALFLVPPPKDCHLMGSFNRMGSMHLQLMRVTHREWVGVMTRIPVTCWDGGSAAKWHSIFSSCGNRFFGNYTVQKDFILRCFSVSVTKKSSI